jgi:hypothetical protein
MTQNKKQKRVARARSAKTGESYSTALSHVRNKDAEEDLECVVCRASQTEDPQRSFIVGVAVVICGPCARRANALADRAGDGEVVRLMDPKLHAEMTAAVAWAVKQPDGPGHDLARRMHEGTGPTELNREQLEGIIELWRSAGRPQPT